MTVKTGAPRRGARHARRTEYSRRFGLSPEAVHPLYGEPLPGPRTAPAAPRVGLDTAPVALAVFEPGASGPRRFLARLGTSRTVVLGLHGRPLKLKGLVSVSLGSVAGMMLAQPFDMVTFVAPLYGLVVGGVGAGAGWVAVSRRRAVTIDVEQWRPQLDAIGRILHNADRIGQPFVSPVALRTALHSALWHAIGAADHAGGADVLAAFDEQLTALDQATEATLVELESPSIAARKADVSDRLAAAVRDLGPAPSPGSLAPQRFDAQGPDAARGSDAAQDQTPPVDAGNGASSPDRSELTR